MDWNPLPDLCAVALLTFAFGSVARRGQTPVSRLWLTGWVLIGIHFAALVLNSVPGLVGSLATILSLNTLAAAGLLFTWACVPFRSRPSSRWMLIVLLVANVVYITLNITAPHEPRAVVPAALFFSAGPLTAALLALRLGFTHPLRWLMVGLNVALSAFLLLFQLRTPNGPDLAFDAVIFTIYLGCCLHFWFVHHRSSAGAMVTVAGFFAWSMVFVIAPLLDAFWPQVHVEGEVWNLPKYVVAVGMILLLLEDQIEHNKYLALHDDLTGLPNRRLFHDRLASALERARRSSSHAALLLIDLDQFKVVNDTAGHHIGDLLLQRVSQVFLGRVRRSDTVARTGGDEFSVILEEPVTREDAVRIGKLLAQLLQEPQELDGHTICIGASVGVGIFPEDGTDAQSLCIAADLNMYAEKAASRNGAGRRSGVRSPRTESLQD